MGMGAGSYVEEFLDWFARFVNASDLTCPPTWLEDLVKLIPRDFPLVRLILVMVQYSGDGKIINQRPAPDTCRFISVPELTALAKNPDLLAMLEQHLVYNRTHIETELSRRIGATRARDLSRELELNLCRLAINKSSTKAFATKGVGKASQEKFELMRKNWKCTFLSSWIQAEAGPSTAIAVSKKGIQCNEPKPNTKPSDQHSKHPHETH